VDPHDAFAEQRAIEADVGAREREGRRDRWSEIGAAQLARVDAPIGRDECDDATAVAIEGVDAHARAREIFLTRRQLLEPRFRAGCSQDRCELLDLGRPHAASVARETTLDEYERVRADATRFLIRPAHENRRIEHVVERRSRFSVVEKFQGCVVAIVRRLDPRMEPI
jgi:hypothetical protein